MNNFDFKQLVPDSGRYAIDKAASFLIENPQLIEALFKAILAEDGIFSSRLARVADAIDELKSTITNPYHNQIINSLPTLKTEGVKRSLARIITRHSSPNDNELLALLINTCFNWLNNPNEAIAIKYYGMLILFNITKSVPEIKQELAFTIEELLPRSSAVINSAGKKIFKKLLKS